jgi:uncharacterized membrane protein YedE/YeeE
MIQSFRKFFFTLYEQRRLRNWFYTLAFAIFVPTGFRFAVLAWEFGDWFDKPLAVLAGLLIGITAAVTLLRIWTVAPRLTVDTKAGAASEETAAPNASASQIYAAAKLQAAHNRQIARGAAALGPAHRWPFEH